VTLNKPKSTSALDGLYDCLVDERLSAELASLLQTASIEALPAEERSARLAEAFARSWSGS
jgi:hypothetical protein